MNPDQKRSVLTQCFHRTLALHRRTFATSDVANTAGTLSALEELVMLAQRSGSFHDCEWMDEALFVEIENFPPEGEDE